MTEYFDPNETDHAGMCFCPGCTAKRFIDIHVSIGYDASELIETIACAMIMVLSAAPDDYRAELTEEILDGVYDSVQFRTQKPAAGELVH